MYYLLKRHFMILLITRIHHELPLDTSLSLFCNALISLFWKLGYLDYSFCSKTWNRNDFTSQTLLKNVPFVGFLHAWRRQSTLILDLFTTYNTPENTYGYINISFIAGEQFRRFRWVKFIQSKNTVVQRIKWLSLPNMLTHS